MNKIIRAVAGLVIMLIVNISLFNFVTQKLAIFWISYAFAMIAGFVAIGIFAFYAVGKEPLHNYPIIAFTGIYLGVSLVVAVIFMLLPTGLSVVAFYLQLIILLVYVALALYTVFANNTNIKNEQARSADIMNFKYILSQLSTIMNTIPYSDPSRKIVEHAYDAVNSGQVSSSDAVKDVEGNMIDKIVELENAVSEGKSEEIEALCKKIEALAKERQFKLTNKAPF